MQNIISNKWQVNVKKVIAIFEIHETKYTPYHIFKIKILEDNSNNFSGFPNIAIKNKDGNPEWISGIGATPTEALNDTLKWLLQTFLEHGKFFTEEEFVWADDPFF